jgi:hypothetical protein
MDEFRADMRARGFGGYNNAEFIQGEVFVFGREDGMRFTVKSIALAALIVVTSAQSYAQPLRSTSIPSSLADDEKKTFAGSDDRIL